ncbi:MAG TPA: AIR synthase-related protein, partial [Planctomycetota bacterium]|nr:AIR synthase-related protein [Planctomycetota bacterium]
NVSIELNVNNIDIIPEALEIAHQGKLSKGLLRNKNYASYYTDFQNNIDMEHQYVLFDPQTSGGLLIAVDPAQADAFYQELQDNVPSAQKIGRVIEQQKKAIFVTK